MTSVTSGAGIDSLLTRKLQNHGLLLVKLRVTRWVLQVEQEMLTLPEQQSSPPVFSKGEKLCCIYIFIDSGLFPTNYKLCLAYNFQGWG
jgi:hypothetical protein